jgi:hypothetical protein
MFSVILQLLDMLDFKIQYGGSFQVIPLATAREIDGK